MNQNWLKQPRVWIIALIGLLTAIGVGIGINARQNQVRFSENGTDIPIVNAPSGATTVGIEAAFPNGEGEVNGRSQLNFRLSQGQAEPDSQPSLPLITGEPLTDAQIQEIVERLPNIETDESDQQDFRLPDELIPPPRPGETIAQPFPLTAPEIDSEEVVSGPLEVIRFSPEGELPLVPTINVTFNQPMVPLTTVEALTAVPVPINITPELPGTWQWLGTQTVSFEAEATAVDRLPMATEYTVEIPAGTQSLNGGTLAETVSWTFSTPPVQMTNYYPSGSSQPIDPIFFIAFDQLIDPQAVLNSIEVKADNRAVSVQLATPAEVEADSTVSRWVENAADGRFITFRAQQPLPTDANIIVTVGPNTPSAEGPRVTTEAQRFDFRTYAPLRITESRCGWGNDVCPPLTPLFIEFNNAIDLESYDPSMLQISPELPNAQVNIFGNAVQIEGLTTGRTTYRVRVSAELQDVFGQTLGDEKILRFEVGSAPSLLSGPDQPFITLDPSATAPVFTVYSINYDNLEVQAYAVEPEDWQAYRTYLDEFWREDRPTPPGEMVLDETIAVNGEVDQLTETAVNLSKALTDETGHLIIVVQPPANQIPEDRDLRPVQAWVQVTQIGLDAFKDQSQMVVWTNALQDGAPLSNVNVRLMGSSEEAATDSDGIARLELPINGSALLIAQQGEDIAILPSNPYYYDQYAWQQNPRTNQLRWHVFDDRHLYRPGEEVHIKGWIRELSAGPTGDVSLMSSGATAVSYSVMGPQDNELFNGEAELNALGGFDLNFTLPENSNLGYGYIRLRVAQSGSVQGQEHYHDFQIQEFRRPEFEVTAQNETSGPYFVSDYAVVATSASYFSGGPLANAEVNWSVRSSPSSYSPPNRSDFTFGTWTPWWSYDFEIYEEEAYFFDDGFGNDTIFESFSGSTDAAGQHFLRLDFDAITAPQPFSIIAEATVMDVNRQAWTAGTTLLVHPSDLYVGIRSERTFVKRGQPLEIEAIVTDLDGNAIANHPIELQAARLDWQFSQGRWQEVEVDVQTCTVNSAEEAVACSFETEVGGSYLITAVITDAQGRQNQSQFTRWVSGGSRPPARNVEQETVALIPDKASYQPGETAEILVLSPFSPAEGLLTVSRDGILYTERFQLSDGTATLQIPVTDAHLPNLGLQVDLVGETARTDANGDPIEDVPPRPAYATGSLGLSISTESRELTVVATPQDSALSPGGETAVDVTVTDANGRPVPNAELAVVIVDEAVLALSNYQLADPISTFYSRRSTWLNGFYGRANIVLANPDALRDQANTVQVQATQVAERVVEGEFEEVEEAMDEEMADGDDSAALAFAANETGGETAQPQQIQVRTNFDPLAIFAPTVTTDSNGQATVNVTLPDNLTRYRIMVVAAANENQFGTAEANLTARLPLMVRPSAPRFLNFGDQFELPIIVQNQTDEPMEVDVVVEATNLELTSGAGQRVMVPANDRVEVRFPVTTADPGTARVQIAAVSGDFADAATVSLPVYSPATTEAFATYGVIDEGAIAQPVAVPEGVFTQFGGLEISTSSTALQALTDAVLYLSTYPYEHSEQAASRIMAISALRDVLTAFEAEGLPSPEALETAVVNDIERLAGMQNFDGGFPIWQRNRDSIPYYSIYVAHALTQADAKGYDVPDGMMAQSLDYLRNIESYYPSTYGPGTRRSLSAYALYVRQLMGDADPNKARNLLAEQSLDDWTLEGLAWLWPVLDGDTGSAQLSDDIYRHLQNRAVETANAANFTTSYGDQAHLMLHSNRRTDGMILDALIRLRPESDLIPKVVNGLLAHRVNGRWHNTQENSFILIALDRYFNTFEAETPDFVARIWLGDTYAGEHAFAGRTTERYETAVPMDFLFESSQDGSSQDLIVDKDGVGRLYYRLGLQYAPTNFDLDPLDRGFVVERAYEGVDDPDDVYQDDDGMWHIKAGARVRVTLTMVANNRRYHVALVDPLPAGLEIVNPDLAITSNIPVELNRETADPYSWWWQWHWYDHENLRDERAEAFTPLLWEGVYTYSYIARATTPGTFVVPPTKAEEMYSPEVFGRSGSDWVIVE